ncbi:MAG: glycosyltransferase family 2 protein [Nitrososphaerales archaeon]
MQASSVRMMIAIPAYNEEKNIASVVVEAQRHTLRVVVCDDGSTDMTGEIAERLGAVVIRHQTNMGKGVAIKDLFRKAKEIGADVVITMDGDGQHDARQIPLLAQPVLDGSADVVNGSRFLKKNPIPNHRRLGDGALNGLTNAVSHGNLTDTQSGFRAYSRTALERIEVKEHAIGVDSQLLIDASQKGLRVTEVPIDVVYMEDSSTYHPARHGAYVILSILRIATERSPLLYLGIPGIISLLVGAAVSLNVIVLYNAERYFSIPQAMIALGTFILGLVLILGAVMLYSINNLVLRLRQG